MFSTGEGEIPKDQFHSFAEHVKTAGLISGVAKGIGRVAKGMGKTTWGAARALTKGPLGATGLIATGVGTAAVGGSALTRSVVKNKNLVQQPWTQRGF